jgi:hypothetical protein
MAPVHVEIVNVTPASYTFTAGAVVRPRDGLSFSDCDASRSEYWVTKAERCNSVVGHPRDFLVYPSGLSWCLVASHQFRAKRKSIQRGSPTAHDQHQDPSSAEEKNSHRLKTDGSTITFEEYYSSHGHDSAKRKSGKKETLQQKWPAKCPTDLALRTETNTGPILTRQPTSIRKPSSTAVFLGFRLR